MSVAVRKTVLDVINSTTAFFQQRGIESPRLTIELMLAHALNQKRLQLYLAFERVLDETTLARLRDMVRRRAAGEPLQYILGKTEFYGLEIQVDKRVLIPRPETELLVEHVIAACQGSAAQSSATSGDVAYSAVGRVPPRGGSVTILDLGTGSGCIAISLAKHLPSATITATDRSLAALELARMNAAKLGVEDRVRFIGSDLFSALSGAKFDWIVSNPPYIATSEADKLPKEVGGHEPLEALFAGDDGLAVIRRIIAEAPAFLSSGGQVALEMGAGQSESVQKLFRDAQYQIAKVVKDYQNHERLVIALHG